LTARYGHYPVAAQIRAVLPRFRGLSDREILQQSFKLADAQELAVRQVGFESWQTLKAGVQAMTDTKTSITATPALNAAKPNLFVADFEAACAFYTEKLGLRDRVHLRRAALLRPDPARSGAAEPTADPPTGLRRRHPRARGALGRLDDRGQRRRDRALFAEFQAAGVDFFRALKQEPWGARTFIVRDPDGNLLLFAGTAN